MVSASAPQAGNEVPTVHISEDLTGLVIRASPSASGASHQHQGVSHDENVGH